MLKMISRIGHFYFKASSGAKPASHMKTSFTVYFHANQINFHMKGRFAPGLVLNRRQGSSELNCLLPTTSVYNFDIKFIIVEKIRTILYRHILVIRFTKKHNKYIYNTKDTIFSFRLRHICNVCKLPSATSRNHRSLRKHVSRCHATRT